MHARCRPAVKGFSERWLRLREPFDRAARQRTSDALALTERLAPWRLAAGSPTLDVLDLACGNGANLRSLAPRLGGMQHWRLVDHDAALLDHVPDALAEWSDERGYRLNAATPAEAADAADAADAWPVLQLAGPGFSATVRRRTLELARGLPTLGFTPGTLVAASALLDLVSAAWLQSLIDQARDAGAAMLFALTVDGRIVWRPCDPEDDMVALLFAQHQRRDKGFGPALGAQAAAVTLQQMAGAGYRTWQAPTDWHIDGALDAEMQQAMVQGIADAAAEQQTAAQPAVRAWQARRLALVNGTCLRVGHTDIVATPPR
jgi:hypothetical protein